jgi:hypothetical protein
MERSRKALWPVAVIAGWVGGLLGLVTVDDNLAILVAFLWTAAAGALLDRWWASALPFALVAVELGIAYLIDPSCSDCGEDPYSLQLLYGLVLLAMQGSVAMAIGVGVRRAARTARRGSPPPARPVP